MFEERTDDRILIKRLSGGDGAAFWMIWQNHQAHLAEICRRQMHGTPSDADDAMSRSMLVAHDKLPEYAASIKNIQAWLTRLSSNICLDIHRERQRAMRGVVNVDDFEHSLASALPDGGSPETEYLASEIGRNIKAAIGELPPALRDAARMRFVEEASYSEMAEKLSITQENARKRVEQSRRLLRERLRVCFESQS